jgi:gamma-glutamylcyclotransferase (GGCT)/AIG2-like uncharacterized protein YtfP
MVIPWHRVAGLEAILQMINRARSNSARENAKAREEVREALGGASAGLVELAPAALLEALLNHPERRLAVYGSLAPGEVNHWVVADLPGTWETGTVHGTLEKVGWGDAIGFPGMTWVPRGDPIPVTLFTSAALPEHWRRIDEFEGADYRRILVPVVLSHREIVIANIYELRKA